MNVAIIRLRRSDSGYSLYDMAAFEQLRFIRTAQSVGFSLEDIKALLGLDGPTSCKKVQELIEDRLAYVGRRIDELRRVDRTLRAALSRCQRSGKACPVLGDLRKENKRPHGPGT